MACPDIFEALRAPTEHLGREIHFTPSPATPYYNMVPRGTFPKNSGVEMTTFVMGRVEPDSKSAGWSDVGASPNTNVNIGGAICADNFTEVPVGFNELKFKPRKLQLKGPPLCKEQFTYAHMPETFVMEHYVPSLANYTKRKIDLEFRDQYIKMGNKVSVAAAGFAGSTTGVSTLPTVQPTNPLTWEWLDGLAARMIRDGASSDGRVIEIGKFGPIFDIYIGLEALTRLFTNVPAIYGGFQFADMGKGDNARTLLSVGESVVVKNWRFHPVTHPPRYDYVGGILVEAEAFETEAAGFGSESVETDAYNNADFEAAVIPNLRQWRADVVSPDNAGLDFDPTPWTGEWSFVTGGSRITVNAVCYDPLHKWGQHFSEYVYAPEPIHKNYGWTIFHLRCPEVQAFASCTTA